MKFFKLDISKTSTGYLLDCLKKLSLGLFATGLLAGMSIIMAGVASSKNKSLEAIILSGIAMFFLFFSIFFYTRLYKSFLPEIESRMRKEK